MNTLDTIEIKTFVPAKDYPQSKAFYLDLGFKPDGESAEVAYFSHGDCAFLLQNFYAQELAENLMMHLLVKDVES